VSGDRRSIPVVRHGGAGAQDCPLAPPAQASVHARTLHRACLVIGGIDKLAAQLNASIEDMRKWMCGEEPPPQPVFLGAVEIVLLYAERAGRTN
jgi:hypothetical protein